MSAIRAVAWALVIAGAAVDAALLRPAVRRHGRRQPWTMRTRRRRRASPTTRQFFANPSYCQAMVNSLEVTAIVTVVSVLLAYPFAWILAEQVPRALAAAGADARRAAVLDLLCRALLQLAPGARREAASSTVRSLALGLLDEPLQLANTRFATVHRLRAFLRHAADADDLRQPQAAQPELPQGRRRSRRRAGRRPSSMSSCR